jgi:hypothetical protein
MPENNPTDNPLIDRRFQNAYLNLVSQIINKNITLTLQEKNAFFDLFDNKKLNAFTRYEKLRNPFSLTPVSTVFARFFGVPQTPRRSTFRLSEYFKTNTFFLFFSFFLLTKIKK